MDRYNSLLEFRRHIAIQMTLLVNRIICYKKLWKLLIDRGLNKVELQRLTGVSSATITKLAKNETVNTRVLIQICNALECDVSDIMEMQDKELANRSGIRRL